MFVMIARVIRLLTIIFSTICIDDRHDDHANLVHNGHGEHGHFSHDDRNGDPVYWECHWATMALAAIIWIDVMVVRITSDS